MSIWLSWNISQKWPLGSLCLTSQEMQCVWLDIDKYRMEYSFMTQMTKNYFITNMQFLSCGNPILMCCTTYDSKSPIEAMLQHTRPTWRDPLFDTRGRSFYNHEQLHSDCPGRGTKSFRKKGQPSDTRSLISPEILISPRGCSISLLCFPVARPFLFFSLQRR